MSERSAVQNPMIKYAQQIGWTYVRSDDALRLRGGETGRFFTDVLAAQLVALNPGVVDAARAVEVIRQLSLLSATIQGNRDALGWLRGEGSVFVADVISPDAFLRDHIDDYRALTGLYATVQLAYSQRTYTDPDLTEKTRRLLRENTSLYSLELPGTIHELGPAELAALKQDDTSETVKVLNLSKAIAKKVEQEAVSDPFLISIGEQAEALKQSYEDRQISTQQALAGFEQLAQQIVDAGAQRQTLGLSANGFAVYTALRAFKGDLTADQARPIDALFAGFPDYKWNQQQSSALRAQLYMTLKPLVGTNFIKATNALMNVRRA